MHIAIEASTWSNPRGFGRFTRELVRALVRLNTRHALTLVLDSGAARADDLPDGTRRALAGTRRAVIDAATSGGARSPFDLWRMSRALSAREYDIVLFPTIYAYAPVFSSARIVLVVHDALPDRLPHHVFGTARDRLFWRAKAWLACRQAAVIATASQAAARDIRRHLPVGRTPLVVLSAGAAAIFTPRTVDGDEERRAALVPAGQRYVLYVGGYSPHKRVAQLVTAFGELVRRDDMADLRLLLAGPTDDGFHSDLARVEAARLALGPHASRVVLTDYVADDVLAALYRGAAVVVLPSLLEGFGLPAVEAMASGAPLLVGDTPALRELCGDAALYVSAAEDTAPMIARVLTEPALAARLRAAGPARAAEVGWTEAAARLLAAIDTAGGRA